jgi:hypothetical protein
MPLQPTCCIPGCRTVVAEPTPAGPDEALCREHLALASRKSRDRMLRAQIRLIHLEAKLHDDLFFQRLVESGRYLKFVGVVGHASDLCAATWATAKREILDEVERRRRARTGSASEGEVVRPGAQDLETSGA